MALSDKFSNLINGLLIALIIYNLFFKATDRPKLLDRGVEHDVELTTPGRLLNSTGQLSEVGWSRKYIKAFDFADVHPVVLGMKSLTALKYKRFNFYSFTFDNKLLQLAIGDVNYLASVFLNLYDYDTREYRSESVKMFPVAHSASFPKLIDDPFNCTTNSFSVKKNGLDLHISTELTQDICTTKIDIKWNEDIKANLFLYRDMTEDDIYDITPISEDNRYFFYALKTYNNGCEGTASIKGFDLKMSKDTCLGMADYGRGIMRYHTSWIWASGSGFTTEGHKLSLNLGQGISNINLAIAEDGIKIDGKIVKLNPLEIIYDPSNLSAGFKFETSKHFPEDNHSASLTFKTYESHRNSENFILLSSKLDYQYGTYSGRITDDTGKVHEFIDIPGIVEIAAFRW